MRSDLDHVTTGELLWTPGPERRERAHLTRFRHWLAADRGLVFDDYEALWRWSVRDLEGFWGAVWDYFAVRASTPPHRVLGERAMPGAEWFPGARLNYAEHVLRGTERDAEALVWAGEDRALGAMSGRDLAERVRTLATRLRELGVRPGDRVAAYLPNIPEAVVAMLAATAVGAVWAACSPDFGVRGALDRLARLEPAVLFAADGYTYAGRRFDRRAQVERIAAALPGLRAVVRVAPRDTAWDPAPSGGAERLDWAELLAGPAVGPEGFDFEQVPFHHPLWVLFTSGTTGPPKAIMHGHGGILVEQLKLHHFHMDLHPGERMLFFTTTGWMMWNFLASSPLAGAVPVLYDGSPSHPEPDALWRLAAEAQVTFLGTAPAYVQAMRRAGLAPGREHDLTALRTVMPAGAPVGPSVTAWFYRDVKSDLWVATGSGGTDCCTGLVGGVPTLPVRAGEMQARSLGVAARAFDAQGRPVTGEVGELVVTEPMPSMPVGFWGDEDGSRYHAAYFSHFPGVWRHGDFFEVNERGGCFVPGRSDATLNRHGVRIGTAEIYHAVEELPEIDGALAVGLADGAGTMVLFVRTAGDAELDEALRGRIRERLRGALTPRHVPDEIVAVPAIPTTVSGKKMEIPVRRILQGTPPDQAADPAAMADPAALDAFLHYARTRSAS